MALIECAECRKQISDRAASCIHCGCPVELSDKHTQNDTSESSVDETGLIVGVLDGLDAAWGVGKKNYKYRFRDVYGNTYLASSKTEVIYKEWSTDVEVGDVACFEMQFDEEGYLSSVIFDSAIVANEYKFAPINTVLVESSDASRVTNLATPKAETSATPEAKTESTSKQGWIVTGVICLVAAGYWGMLGFPHPHLFFSKVAEDRCHDFAREKQDSLSDGEPISTGESWIKDGRRVVQLYWGDSGSMSWRLCVYGRGQVMIPSLLNQARWE